MADETKKDDMKSVTSPAFILELIHKVGLPGCVILAWLGAIFTDKYKPEHLLVWGALVGASVIYAIFACVKDSGVNFRELSKRNKQDHYEQAKQLHKLAELSIEQLKINKEIYAVIGSQLSVKHLTVLLPIFMEAFKWKVFTTLVPAYDDLTKNNKTIDISMYLQVSQMYFDAMMLPLVKQHMFFKDAYVEQQFRKCIDEVFVYIQSEEFRDLKTKEKQDRMAIQKINTMFSDIYTALNEYLETMYDL